MIRSEIKLATFRLLTYCLNQLQHHVPHTIRGVQIKKKLFNFIVTYHII